MLLIGTNVFEITLKNAKRGSAMVDKYIDMMRIERLNYGHYYRPHLSVWHDDDESIGFKIEFVK